MTKNLAVLVAEDSHDLRQFMRVMLRALGVSPVLVENGQEAIEAAEKDRFDLVFLDIQMPVLNGYQAMRALREKGFSGLLYALTGLTLEEPDAIGQAGFDGFLVKPVTRNELQEVLQKVRDRSESQG
jgi:CheY-like chemotaxis protein